MCPFTEGGVSGAPSDSGKGRGPGDVAHETRLTPAWPWRSLSRAVRRMLR